MYNIILEEKTHLLLWSGYQDEGSDWALIEECNNVGT